MMPTPSVTVPGPAELDTPEAEASAWVPGPQTPAWGGPATVQKQVPEAVAEDLEAGL